MLPTAKISIKNNGIYDALKTKEHRELLSDKTMVKLLQILHDDLLDINNIVYTSHAKKIFANPASTSIRSLALKFLAEFGLKDDQGRLIPPDEYRYDGLIHFSAKLNILTGYYACRRLVKKMLTKHLFVYELCKAKELLTESPWLPGDPNRNELKEFIERVESKARQQKTEAINNVMHHMSRMQFFASASESHFTMIVEKFITVEYEKNKTQLRVVNNGLTVKRRAKGLGFTFRDKHYLKNKIESILEGNTGLDLLRKEMEMWEKLNEIQRQDAVKYQQGIPVTLYYTGVADFFDWYTEEECIDNNYPLKNPTKKEIPSEQVYIEEVERLEKRYKRNHQDRRDGYEGVL
ncbi:hypothetical protein [Enterobacter sp. Bisph1]|uniref:hypothetical protein n=1 Tax=Enterobacter sp. Bisph1 TaxID=1274399 RepID=UPI00057C3156|nr:hypothetical protein [Enterobacter sp. Bisph1]